ncbi:MAG: hypothetical protein EA425_12010 [Puniceicoccaceae bacterium]|nr:MAG: hypothetical protein EA425_12010 [Puniceicoccaceae bacterium]
MTGLLAPPLAPASADGDLTEVWKRNRLLLFNEAHLILRDALPPGADEATIRTHRFARAVTLLNVQPRTQANLQQSEQILLDLKEPGTPEDEITVAALYYLGRIDSWYRSDRNLRRSLDWYRQAMDYWPDHDYAQQAALRWISLHLFFGSGDTHTRLTEAEQMRSFFQTTSALRDYHFMMASAWTHLETDGERILHHSKATLAHGLARENSRKAALLHVAEWSRELGDPHTALLYYRQFLEEFPQDNRAYMVERRIEELEDLS